MTNPTSDHLHLYSQSRGGRVVKTNWGAGSYAPTMRMFGGLLSGASATSMALAAMFAATAMGIPADGAMAQATPSPSGDNRTILCEAVFDEGTGNVSSTGSGTGGADGGDAADNPTTNNALACGRDALATGLQSTAIGPFALASGDESTALGDGAQATADRTIAVGNAANASANDAVAIGNNAEANSDRAIAIGINADGFANDAIAVGNTAEATGDRAVAIGNNADAFSNDTVAIGNLAEASGDRAVAMGINADALSNDTVAIGNTAEATADRAVAIGVNADALNNDTVAIGNTARATANNATALGTDSIASGQRATALGNGAEAFSEDGTAMGADAVAHAGATRGLALGSGSDVFGARGVAIGPGAEAIGERTVSIGDDSQAQGSRSLAIGADGDGTGTATTNTAVGAEAVGDNSIALGTDTFAGGERSIAMGNSASAANIGDVALGADSITEGVNTSYYGGSDVLTETAPTSVVAIGGTDPNSGVVTTRQIQGVAPGANGTDAVNVDQLRNQAAGVDTVIGQNIFNDDGTTNTATFNTPGTGNTVNNITDAINAIDTQVDINTDDIDNIETNADSFFGGGANIANGDAPTYNIDGDNFNDVGSALEAVETLAADKDFITEDSGAAPSVTGTNASAGGAGAVANGENSLAVGPDARATGNSTTAIGHGAVVNLENGTAVGAGAVVNQVSGTAVGFGATADGVNSTAIGSGATASNSNDVALGFGSTTSGVNTSYYGGASVLTGAAPTSVVAIGNRQIQDVAPGSNGTDAVNVDQLSNQAGVIDTLLTGGTGNAIGANGQVIGDAFSYNSNDFDNVQEVFTAIGTDISSITSGGLVQQAGTPGSGNGNPITVGAATGGTEVNFSGADGVRTLTGVDAGDVSAGSTEAVNGSQLFDTNQDVADNASDISDIVTNTNNYFGSGDVSDGTNPPSFVTPDGNVDNVAEAFDNFNDAVTDNTTDITNLTNNITNGTIGLVQQAAAGDPITVGKDTDGDVVEFNQSGGATRTLSGLTDGEISATSTEAINGSQLSALGNSADTVIGQNIFNDDGTTNTAVFNTPGAGNTVNNITDAINAIDGQVDTNTTNITDNANDITNLTNNINNGTIGLVQQQNAGDPITVGADTDGDEVQFNQDGGATRTLSGLSDGEIADGSTEAVTGNQIADRANADEALLGIDAYDDDGNLTGDGFNYDASDNAANAVTDGSIQDVFNAVDGDITQIATNTNNFFGSGDVTDGTDPTFVTPDGDVNNVAEAFENFNDAVGDNTDALEDIANGEGIRYFRNDWDFPEDADAQANGAESLAIGARAVADGERSIAQGDGATASGDNAIAIGSATSGDTNNVTAAGANSIAMGTGANAATDGAVALGQGATAQGGQSVSIGVGNVANGNGAVAIGNPNTVNGQGAVGLGAGNTATGEGAVALGDVNTAIGLGSVAIGDNAQANSGGLGTDLAAIALGGSANASDAGAVSIGANSSATTDAVAMGNNADAISPSAIAFGLNAQATNAGAVAIGSGSATKGAAQISSVTIGNTTFGGFEGASQTFSVVSVGSDSEKRQIVNVAPGDIASDSTDAINGSQLFAVATEVDNNATAIANLSSGAAGAFVTEQTGGVAPSATGTNASAGGNGATADGDASLALGNNAAADGDNSIAIAGTATGTFSTAVGGAALADDSVAIGGGIAQNVDSITIGRNARDGDPDAGSERNIAIGVDSGGALGTIIGSDNLALGTGATLSAGVDNGVALGTGATVTNSGDVALGAGSTTGAVNNTGYGNVANTATSVVSVGNRQIQGVASGTEDDDAVNVAQLRNQAEDINTLIGQNVFETDGSYTAPDFEIGNTTFNNVTDAINAIDDKADAQGNDLADNLFGGNVVYNEDDGTFSGGLDYTAQTTGGIDVNDGTVQDVVDQIQGDVGQNQTDITNLTNNINNGTIGIVQQAAAGAPITVGADTDGDEVQFNQSGGATRTLSGLTDGTIADGSTEAVTGNQIADRANADEALLGIDAYDDDGNLTGDGFNYSSNTTGVSDGSVQDVFTAIDGDITALQDGDVGLVRQAGTPGAGNVADITVGAETDGTVVDFTNLSDEQRVLTGVADGEISATSFEAINGSQISALADNTNSIIGGGANITDGTLPTINVGGVATQQSVADAANAQDAIVVEQGNSTAAAFGGTSSYDPTTGTVTAGIEYDGNTRTDVQTVVNDIAGDITDLSSGAVGGFVTEQTGGVAPQATGENASAGGNGAVASGDGALALGNGAEAASDQGIAIGQTAGVGSMGNYNSAMGLAAGQAVDGNGNVANGAFAGSGVTGDNNIATGSLAGGNVNGSDNIAMGRNAGRSITASQTVAIGFDSTASANDGIALGAGATATNEGDVALGANSTTVASTNNAYFTGTAAPMNGVVSVGDRRIQGVAAGAEADEAVNVAQLNAVAQAGAAALGGTAAVDPVTGAVTAPTFEVGNTTTDNVTDAINAIDDKADEQGDSLATNLLGGDVVYDEDTGEFTGGFDYTSSTNATDIDDGTVQDVFDAVEADVTQNTSDINNLINGTAGLVQQAGPGAPITVGADTDGTEVQFDGTAGTRTLSGVSDGLVDATSDEAVNGSQLFAQGTNINEALGSGDVLNDVAPTFTSVDGNTTDNVADALSEISSQVDTNTDDIADNAADITELDNRVTTNETNIANNTQNIADNRADIDTNATNIADNSTAIENITNGTAGIVRQEGGAPGDGVITVGAETQGTEVSFANSEGVDRTLSGVADGEISATSTEAVNGSQLFATNEKVNQNMMDIAANHVKIEENAGDIDTLERTSVRYDTDMNGNLMNSITLGNGVVVDGPIVIRNVGNGTAPNDAVNVSQLRDAVQEANDYTDARVMELAINVDNRLNDIEFNLEDYRQEAQAGIASVMAVSQIRYDDRPGKLSIGAGVGGFIGQISIASGIGYTSEDQDVRINAGFGYNPNRNEATWGAGATFTLN